MNHLLHAQMNMSYWQFLPALLHLNDAHSKLASLSTTAPAKEVPDGISRRVRKAKASLCMTTTGKLSAGWSDSDPMPGSPDRRGHSELVPSHPVRSKHKAVNSFSRERSSVLVQNNHHFLPYTSGSASSRVILFLRLAALWMF